MTTAPQANETKSPSTTRKSRFWFWAVFWIVSLLLAFNSLFAVSQEEIGVVSRFDQSLKEAGPGLHLKIPLLESAHKLKTRTRLAKQEIQALSKEQLALTLAVSANWHIRPAGGVTFFRELGSVEKFESQVLLPQLKAVTSRVIGKYDVAGLLEQQDAILKQIYMELDKILLTDSLEVDSLQIEQITLPEKYRESVNNMLIEQNLVKAEQLKAEKSKVKLEGELAMTETEKAVEQSKADAEAYAIVKKAEAEAKAIQLKSEALQQNRVVVDYMRVNKWDGKLAPGKEGADAWKLPEE